MSSPRGRAEPDPVPGHQVPQAIVAEGYDRLGPAYERWANTHPTRQRQVHTGVIIKGVRPGSRVLDLGCGSGRTLECLARTFAVTGVDVSRVQITLARNRVPGAKLIVGNMTTVTFRPESFGGVCALYSITHVPREEHARLFGSIYTWLSPGGLFVASLGSGSERGSVEDRWLGVPMYFSHWDAGTNTRLITEAGFDLVSEVEETTEEDGQPVSFLWVVARKPVRGPGCTPRR